MSAIYDVPQSLRQFLDDHDALYQVIPHPRDFCAQRAAADTFTPGRAFAKCVVLWIDNYYALAVLPADHLVDFQKLLDATGSHEAGLVTEAELRRLFPDCELGAESPFGNLYELPVYAAQQLTEDAWITFNAGTHEEAIRMPYMEFVRLVNPTVVDFACKG